MTEDASKEYTTLHKEYGVTISMTEGGNPKDSAQAERINNTMKNELLKGKMFCNCYKKSTTGELRFK